MPILMVARAMPIVRTTRCMRCFWPAKTCSAADRTIERFALALAVRTGIGRFGGFLRWMWLVSRQRLRKASFFFDR